MNVSPVSTPSVTISFSSNNICEGTAVIFNAVPVNGGATPSFKWLKNGVAVGNNAPAYTNNALKK